MKKKCRAAGNNTTLTRIATILAIAVVNAAASPAAAGLPSPGPKGWRNVSNVMGRYLPVDAPMADSTHAQIDANSPLKHSTT